MKSEVDRRRSVMIFGLKEDHLQVTEERTAKEENAKKLIVVRTS